MYKSTFENSTENITRAGESSFTGKKMEFLGHTCLCKSFPNWTVLQTCGEANSICAAWRRLTQPARDPALSSLPSCVPPLLGPSAPVAPAQPLSRAMLLDLSGAKRLAGPTKLRSSVRFAMHISDLNEKQTGLTQAWQAHAWQRRPPGQRKLKNKRRSTGLTCKCKLIVVKLPYQRRT